MISSRRKVVEDHTSRFPTIAWTRRARFVTPSAILAFVLLPLLSCTHSRPLIYVIPRTTATLFWESVHTGTLVAAKEDGLRIYWNAATREDDVDRQIELVKQASDRRPIGIVLAPDHTAALLTSVRALLNAGLPMVVIESRLPLPPGPNLTYIVSDHVQAGRDAARMVVATLPNARIAILGLNPDIDGNLKRSWGFEQELAASASHAVIAEKRFSRFNRQETEGQMESILETDPSVDMVFALSPPALLGALDAIERRKPSHRIHLIGCDQDMDLIDPLRSGKIDALLIQDTYRQGFLAVHAIAERRRSGHWPPEVVTETRLVTLKDLADPTVHRALTMSPER